jgi:hypothetical protein
VTTDEPPTDWRRHYVGLHTRARRVLETATLTGRWQVPPTSVLLDHVEAGAIEAAADGLRRLAPPGGLARAERQTWRRAAAAAEAEMRRAAADRITHGTKPSSGGGF